LIGIVDYGAGNIQSVMNALSFCGAKFCLALQNLAKRFRFRVAFGFISPRQ